MHGADDRDGANDGLDLPAGLGLRAAADSDGTLFFRLFVEARPWLALVDGDDALLRTLYAQQFRAMESGLRASYPHRLDRVVEHDGAPVGRIVLARGAADWRIAELQIAAAMRRRGIGSSLLRALQAAAARAGVTLSLSVASTGSQARPLYERLGFLATADDGVVCRMVWSAA